MEKRKKSYLLEAVVAGISSGAALCFSGQYKIAAAAGIVFVLIVLLQKKCKRQIVVCTLFMVVCIFGIKAADHSFVSRVVEPMRQSGEWLPSGGDWVVTHVTSKEPLLGYAYLSEGDFKDTQVMNINTVEQPDYTACESTGAYIFVYLKTMLKHPAQFLTSCGNKLFLAFCMDAGGVGKGGLATGFVLFYLGMCVLIQRYFGNGTIEKLEYFVCMLFLLTVVPPCAMHMELRYAMAVQNFIFGAGIFGLRMEKDVSQLKKYTAVFMGGVLFVMFCVMHYMAILD